jgi:S-adenosylmethionine hydrolase
VFQKPQRAGKRTWVGQILKIDHFGNLITNFHTEDFPNLEGQNVTFSVGPQAVTVIARNYAETGQGELFAIVGSSGYYEISISQASAAKRIGCVVGGPVELLIG